MKNKRKLSLIDHVKSDWKELNETMKDESRAFRINRVLSNNISVTVIITVIDILLLLISNYFINVCSHISEMANDTENIVDYFGINNLVLSLDLLKSYKTVRILYIFLIIALIILDVMLVYSIHTSFSEKNFNFGQKGKNRWTTHEEIKEQYLEIDEVETEYDGMPGFPISRFEDKLYLDTNMTNNLIIGITRSGKGETHVFPSIDTYSRAKIKPSMIIADVKGEIYKSNQKARTLQKRGYDVYFLNLQDPTMSMGYNPLSLIISEWESGNKDFAEEITQCFVWQVYDPESAKGTEKFFAETAANLTAALILAHVQDCLRMDRELNEKRKKAFFAKQETFKNLDDAAKLEAKKQYNVYITDAVLDCNVYAIPDDVTFSELHEYRKMINMYSIINTYFELVSKPIYDDKGMPTGKNMLDMFFINRPFGDRSRLKYLSTAVSTSKTKASIYSTMNTKLNIYTIESVARMTAESSINLRDIGFGDRPMAIFLGIPDADASKYQIATTFISQVYKTLASQCWDGGTCKRPVKFVLDECGNLPAIEGMSSNITVCAGRNITFDLYIQAYAQLDEKYGDGAKTIRTNCGNKIFIRTDDPNTTEEFSNFVGKKTIVNLQRNGSKFSLKKTFVESSDDKPLISQTELANLLNGEDVVVRTMKPLNNLGEDVEMTPILNSKENGHRLKFRYQYLEEYFPTPKYLSLADVIEESRDHISLKSRVWNPDISFEFIRKDQMLNNKSMTLGELDEYLYNEVYQVLDSIFNDEQRELYQNIGDIPLSRAESIIYAENDVEKLNPYKRTAILAMLNHFLEREDSTNEKANMS